MFWFMPYGEKRHNIAAKKTPLYYILESKLAVHNQKKSRESRVTLYRRNKHCFVRRASSS